MRIANNPNLDISNLLNSININQAIIMLKLNLVMNRIKHNHTNNQAINNRHIIKTLNLKITNTMDPKMKSNLHINQTKITITYSLTIAKHSNNIRQHTNNILLNNIKLIKNIKDINSNNIINHIQIRQ